MEAKITKQISIDLKLSEKEAVWLMGVMQNPLHNETPEEEDNEQAVNRRDLFQALKAAFART